MYYRRLKIADYRVQWLKIITFRPDTSIPARWKTAQKTLKNNKYSKKCNPIYNRPFHCLLKTYGLNDFEATSQCLNAGEQLPCIRYLFADSACILVFSWLPWLKDKSSMMCSFGNFQDYHWILTARLLFHIFNTATAASMKEKCIT